MTMRMTSDHFIFVALAACVLFFSGATAAYAGPLIGVDFENDPLFGASNFLPGDTLTRTVKVTNNDTVTHEVYTQVVDVDNSDHLGDVIDVEVNGGALFSGTFTAFDAANEVFLSTLDAGDFVTYTFAMTFQPEADNAWQNKSLGFDFCVGFAGGNFECDGTVSDNNDGGGASFTGTGGGGGGGGGRSISLNRAGNAAAPVPQVLGAQTSVVPEGAPNTGFGGASAGPNSRILFVLILLVLLFVGHTRLQETHEQ